MLSGAQVSTSRTLNFSNFDAFATAMGCKQSPGPKRLRCLRKVPASTIRTYTNGRHSGGFSYVVDKYAFYPGPRGGAHVVRSVTAFDDPLQRIRTGQFAQVPILLGNMEDDGTVFAHDKSNLSTFLKEEFGRHASRVPPSLVRSLYPGLTDPEVIAAVERDMQFRWCVVFWLDIKGNNG